MRIKKKYCFIALLILIFWSTSVLEGSGRDVQIFEQIVRLSHLFFPPDFSVLPDLFNALIETIKMATISTFIAAIISILLGLLASKELSKAPLRRLIIFLLAFIRSVPSLVLAVLAVAIVGINPLAGVIGLTIYSIGYLGKFFLDILDQNDPKPSIWLKVHGGHPVQIFQYVIWPTLVSALTAKILWMWEYNIRSAAIIGYVGAGGIGLQLHVYQEFGQWNRFSTALLMIFAVVLLIEFLHYLVKKLDLKIRY